MESRGGFPWLLAIGAAAMAFVYIAIIDVVRVPSEDRPSMASEELLILARHGRLSRGDEVGCTQDGEVFTGSVVGLPGELAIASAAGVQIKGRARDRLGSELESLSVTKRAKPLSVVLEDDGEEDDEPVQLAAEPGEVLIASDSEEFAVASVRASSCLPVIHRLKLASLLDRF